MSGDQKTLIKGNPAQYVKLNVGGSLYHTTIGTLIRNESMLRAMFSGQVEVLTDADGWILLDRCGKHFVIILNFLRDGHAILPESTRAIAEVLAEAKYYQIQELVELCEATLVKRDRESRAVKIYVPLIKNPAEEEFLIGNARRPVVRLFMNRHNNKYSYTPASDDNLLKNIELFDKLALLYRSRIIFIKISFRSNEICCWSFYARGVKKHEICCTSIIDNDKKQTKIDCPEARIVEETKSMLQYEVRNGPDKENVETWPKYKSAS